MNPSVKEYVYMNPSVNMNPSEKKRIQIYISPGQIVNKNIHF